MREIKNKVFGEELRKLIKAYSTQKDFSGAIGVSENTVVNWCKGQQISLENYNKVLKFFIDNTTADIYSLIEHAPIDNLYFSQFQITIEDVKKQYDKRYENLCAEVKEIKQRFDDIKYKLQYVLETRESLKKQAIQLEADAKTYKFEVSKKIKQFYHKDVRGLDFNECVSSIVKEYKNEMLEHLGKLINEKRVSYEGFAITVAHWLEFGIARELAERYRQNYENIISDIDEFIWKKYEEKNFSQQVESGRSCDEIIKELRKKYKEIDWDKWLS